MATGTYDEALKRLLADEGGYSNLASDPGGPTNFGITIHDYRAYVMPGATAADVRAMPLSAAKQIYRAKYWDAMRCDELPAGLDYAVFDYGVNSGIARPPKILARILGLTERSKIDAELMAAVAKRPAANLIMDLCDERLAFLKRLGTWPTFGGGWGRRVAVVKTNSLRMASGASSAPPPKAVVPVPGKAKEPVSTVNPKRDGTGAVIVGAGGLSAWFANHFGFGSGVVTGIVVVVAVVAAITWIALHLQQKQQPGGSPP